MSSLTRVGRLVRRHQFDITLVALLLVLHLLGFGQSPGVGVAATLLSAVPILALLFRRVAPPVVAFAYLGASSVSVLLDMPDASSALTVVVVVAGAYSAGAYMSLPWALATLCLWWSSLLVDFVSGRETGGAGDFLFAGLILACGFVPGVVVQRLRWQAEAGRAAWTRRPVRGSRLPRRWPLSEPASRGSCMTLSRMRFRSWWFSQQPRTS